MGLFYRSTPRGLFFLFIGRCGEPVVVILFRGGGSGEGAEGSVGRIQKKCY